MSSLILCGLRIEFLLTFRISATEIVDAMDRRGKGGGTGPGEWHRSDARECGRLSHRLGISRTKSLGRKTWENLGGHLETEM